MSHALALLITDEYPTDEVIYKHMLPYHEYECTGIEEYTKDIDVTKDVINDYNKFIKNNPNGQTIQEYAEDYGLKVFTQSNGALKIINRTNPNAKWDCYAVGGRYNNFLLGSDGNYDILQKKNVRLDLKIDYIRKEIEKDVNELESLIKGRYIPNLDELIKEYGKEKAIDIYNSYEVVKDIHEASPIIISNSEIVQVVADRDSYINKQLEHVGVPFAIIYNDHWYEKGKLCWFGISIGNVEDWNTIFFEIWNDIPDDYWITAIDYHI